MKVLSLKIPPPLLALIFGILMWLASMVFPGIEINLIIRLSLFLFIGSIGLVFTILGLLSFRKNKTTINPLTPDKATSLVQNGIYDVTRNPMYVGLLIYLLAWAVFLSNLYTLPFIAVFVIYTNKFQIVPEEAALSRLFGEEFHSYQTRVRRWL